jgi:hypothetical protein
VFEFVGGLFCAIFDPVKIASSIQTSVTRWEFEKIDQNEVQLIFCQN